MAKMPKNLYDPTLAEADRAIERNDEERVARRYLGMSSIGIECERRLWYAYHEAGVGITKNDAASVRIFQSGHDAEAIIARLLQATPGITLDITDPKTGGQLGVEDFGGEFRGHLDGVIRGLVDDPGNDYVWEAKCVNEKKFADFRKKKDIAEDTALRSWDAIYYAQAQCYMGYSGIHRHYLTVCTPGVRQWEAVITPFDLDAFEAIRSKAVRIINAKLYPLSRISNDPSWHQCKFCPSHDRCHGTPPVPA